MPRNRRSIRLPGYDYSLPGAYFITICVQNGELLLEPTAVTAMINKTWHEVQNKFKNVQLDEFIIMPNHLHGIIVIIDVGADLRVRPNVDQGASATVDPRVCPNADQGACATVDPCVCPNADQGAHIGAPLQQPTLGRIIRWFKTMTTNAYLRGVKNEGWPPFRARLWQRNYYEHIMRNSIEIDRIRNYIRRNPQNWPLDPENPINKKENAQT